MDRECDTLAADMTADPPLLEGGCTCRRIRYRLSSPPLFVHCCHCRWCQRETGSAFALNALIETDRVDVLAGEVDYVQTPSADPGVLPPNIHIWTMSKQPWVILPDDVPVMEEYYRASEHWPAESLSRKDALRAETQEG